MIRTGRAAALVMCIAIALSFLFENIDAAPPDVSDAAITKFLQHSFQYDYTTVTDDASLRQLIDAVDYQMAVINYRGIMEKTDLSRISSQGKMFEQQLDGRYQEIVHDGYLFKLFSEWQNKTQDPIIKSFIDLFLFDREQLLAYPAGMERVRSLAGRIAERLQKFHFKIDGKYYDVNDIRRFIATDDGATLGRQLVRLRRDSSAIMADDALLLYKMYNAMGLEKGGRTWQEYLFLPYSLDYPDWIKIAEEINSATDDIYFAALKKLKSKHHLNDPSGYEINRILNSQAVLPDEYFDQDRIDRAVTQLLANLGLSQLSDRLQILHMDDSASYPVAIYRYPPEDILFVKFSRAGFAGYYRMLSEMGKALPWAYADSTLPYLLRTYAPGTAIMTSELFISLGTDPEFLAANFNIPEEKLKPYQASSKLLTMYQIRQVTQYILFDNKLSSGKIDNPSELFWSLELSTIGTADSSYFWIDALVSGRIEEFPNLLAQAFGRFKMREILHYQIGPDYATSDKTGRFLIDQFCRPGRVQSLKDFIEKYSPAPLSVADFTRQMK